MSKRMQASSSDQEQQRHEDTGEFRNYTELLDVVRNGTEAEVDECLSQLPKNSTDTAVRRGGKKDEDDKSVLTGESTSYRQKLLNALAKKNVGAVWKLIAEGKEDDVKSLETLNKVCEIVAKHERLKERGLFKCLWGNMRTQIGCNGGCGCCNKCCEDEQCQTDLQRDEEQQWIKILSDPLYISLEWLWRNNPKSETQTSKRNVSNFEDVIKAALHNAHLLEKIALFEHHYSQDEYTKRAEECEKFAVDVVDGSNVEELHVIMDIEGTGCLLGGKPHDFNQSLSLLKIAADKERKRFVASPKCQRILNDIVYFEWPHWQDKSRVTKFAWSILQLAIVVLSWVVYIPVRLVRRSPCCDRDDGSLWKFREIYEHPYSKFINHTMWYLVFLGFIMSTSFENKDSFTTPVIGLVWMDYVVLCFVIGLSVQESLEAKRQGFYVYISKWWNVVDTVVILSFLLANAVWLFSWVRFGKWRPENPGFIVADVLYASATVMAFFHLTHIFQIDSVLGPLQLSLYKMLKDVGRFLFIFLVLYLSFATGVVKVYSYYVASQKELRNQNATIYKESVPYANHVDALIGLFWLLLGSIEEEKITLKNPLFRLTSFFGHLFLMVYVVCAVIVALNMLIAMMNSSYDRIMDNEDVEWKFSRARMWLEWIDKGNTMPAPINLIYYPLFLVVRLFGNCFRISKEKCQCCNERGDEEQAIGEPRDEARDRKETRMNTMKDLIVKYLKERYFGKNETGIDRYDDIEDSTDTAH